MKQKRLIFTLFLLMSIQAFGQISENDLPKKELRKSRPTFIDIGIGVNSSNFRDFATSPLFYKGTPKAVFLSRLKADDRRESNLGLKYSFGNYNATVGEHTTNSKVKTFSFYYSQLYQIPKWSSDKWNFKVGGILSATGNFRLNEALQNNALGIEFFATLFGSVKITKDISRKESKGKKILFIKYKLGPRKRALSYQLNFGLMNNSYRNGYVYSGQSGVLNDPKLFDGYVFKSFSGFRMSSSLNYTICLKNKNAIQVSYIWDTYKSGGDLDKFEMANHIIQLSLLFNTK